MPDGSKLNAIDERLKRIEERLTAIEKDIKSIKSILGKHTSLKEKLVSKAQQRAVRGH